MGLYVRTRPGSAATLTLPSASGPATPPAPRSTRTGLFLGAGKGISKAGPSLILAYAIAGLVI
ncbi:hypothetical protein ACWDZ8_29190, partial [Streptomyces sp. NPDC003233]